MKISVPCLEAMEKAETMSETTEREDKKICSSKSPVYPHLTSYKQFGLFPVCLSQKFLNVYQENAQGYMTSSMKLFPYKESLNRSAYLGKETTKSQRYIKYIFTYKNI